MKIRHITADDYKDIYFLNVELNPKLSEFNVDDVYRNIEYIISSTNDISFVMEHENKVIGFIHGSPYHVLFSKPKLLIKSLIVSEVHRGNSIGSNLLKTIEEWAYNNNYYGLRLNCRSTRTESHMFYEKNRYTCTKEQKNFVKIF